MNSALVTPINMDVFKFLATVASLSSSQQTPRVVDTFLETIDGTETPEACPQYRTNIADTPCDIIPFLIELLPAVVQENTGDDCLSLSQY